MLEIIVILTDEEVKAMSIDVVSPHEWVNNAAHNKARQCMDRVVTEHSNKQPGRITNAERNRIVRDAKFKTAKERHDEYLAAIVAGEA